MTCPCSSVPCVCPPCSDTFGCRCPRHFVGPLPTTGLAPAESCQSTLGGVCTAVYNCVAAGHCLARPVPAAAPLRPAREAADEVANELFDYLINLSDEEKLRIAELFEAAILADRAARPAALISEKGVSALCFKKPRPIRLDRGESWVLIDANVDCPRCKKIIAERAARPANKETDNG